MTKFEYGQCLAASLAYLMNRQRDGVGLTAFDDRIVTMLPASARPGHLRAMLVTLDRLPLGTETNVSKPLHQLADSLSKRGMVVLISDLLDDPERVIRGLKHFRFRGTDVIVFHVLDPDELSFPFERATRFEDMETRDEVMAVPVVVRDALSQGDWRAHRAVQARARRCRHRLPVADDGSAARIGAAGVSVDTRANVLMAFLAPIFLVGAAAAAIPIVLHLLKREPETHVKWSRPCNCCARRQSNTRRSAISANCSCSRSA